MTEHSEIPSQARIIVGMSGGVDSSVAALLLIEQGYQVEGLFMKNWEEDDGTQYCTAKEDLADAQTVCDHLGIRLHAANFAAEYWDNVFEHFLKEYQSGRTPNPDILCNREIKFKAFIDYAKMLGADYIATGHYARLDRESGHTWLLRGRDESKDQSYFLYAVPETQLCHALFPVGELEKTSVREIARKAGLETHSKKDSTGICFIGERRFTDFLQRYLPAQPGDIVTHDGHTLGRHNGLMYHTIGQRQGLGIGGHKEYDEAPWYVAGKNLERNELMVVQGNDNPLLFTRSLLLDSIDWINETGPQLPYACTAKIRYRQSDRPCEIIKMNDGKLRVNFTDPQRAVTPGQSIVFYAAQRCLGGGIITQAIA